MKPFGRLVLSVFLGAFVVLLAFFLDKIGLSASKSLILSFVLGGGTRYLYQYLDERRDDQHPA